MLDYSSRSVPPVLTAGELTARRLARQRAVAQRLHRQRRFIASLLAAAVLTAVVAVAVAQADPSTTSRPSPAPSVTSGDAGSQSQSQTIPSTADTRPSPADAVTQTRNGPLDSPARLRALDSIPAPMLATYQRAARESGVSWELLAAVGANESNHGRWRLPGVQSGVNWVGCCAGPAQMCVIDSCGNVWQTNARDGDGDGATSVYNPDDAFVTAAHFLRSLVPQVGRDHARLLAAYNAGAGAVLRYGGTPPYKETQDYVRKGVALITALERP